MLSGCRAAAEQRDELAASLPLELEKLTFDEHPTDCQLSPALGLEADPAGHGLPENSVTRTYPQRPDCLAECAVVCELVSASLPPC